MTKRRGANYLSQCASDAVKVLSESSAALRHVVEAELPRSASAALRGHLLALADRMEDVSSVLGREVDRPESDSRYIRALLAGGKAIGALTLATVSGIGMGVATPVGERLAEIGAKVQTSCTLPAAFDWHWRVGIEIDDGASASVVLSEGDLVPLPLPLEEGFALRGGADEVTVEHDGGVAAVLHLDWQYPSESGLPWAVFVDRVSTPLEEPRIEFQTVAD